jgi:hypothetical protein
VGDRHTGLEALQNRIDRPSAAAAGIAGDEVGKRKAIPQPAHLRFVDCPLELVMRQDGGEIEQGAGDGRDRDTANGSCFVWR